MDVKQRLREMFEPYFHTQESMDSRMIGIMQNKAEYEKRLDNMWSIYLSGNMQQLFPYKDQIKYIKEANLEVLRSKYTGKHKITYKNRR